MGQAVFFLFWLIAAAMMVNAARLQYRSVALYRVLRQNHQTPDWEPQRPQLRLGLYFLRNPPDRIGMDDLDQIDLDGWMAAVRSTLWGLGAVATGFLGVAIATVLGAQL